LQDGKSSSLTRPLRLIFFGGERQVFKIADSDALMDIGTPYLGPGTSIPGAAPSSLFILPFSPGLPRMCWLWPVARGESLCRNIPSTFPPPPPLRLP